MLASVCLEAGAPNLSRKDLWVCTFILLMYSPHCDILVYVCSLLILVYKQVLVAYFIISEYILGHIRPSVRISSPNDKSF